MQKCFSDVGTSCRLVMVESGNVVCGMEMICCQTAFRIEK